MNIRLTSMFLKLIGTDFPAGGTVHVAHGQPSNKNCNGKYSKQMKNQSWFGRFPTVVYNWTLYSLTNYIAEI